MDLPKPFELEYTPQFAELLFNLRVSLVVSTYQAGKVVILSPFDKDRLIQLPRTFGNAMGIAVNDDTIAVAAHNSVEVLKNVKQLARSYPQKPNTYDNIFIPSASYHTGYLALHDMAFIKDELIAVNTLFSSLSYINRNQSFTPFWHPPFISELQPEDRCHLNGIAVENNEIRYVSALGSTDTPQGWRDDKINGGILMEYPSGKIILDGLSMPHSPRIYDGKLYLLNSAKGELIEVDPEKGTYEVIVNLGGFARGMDKIGDYLFIGVSKLRHNSPAFRDLPIAETSFSGIIAVYLPYKSIAAKAEYKMSVDEIYDVKILPGKLRPNVISPDMEIHKQAIFFNENAFWGEAKSEKTAQSNKQTVAENQNAVQLQVIKKISSQELKKLFGNMICKDLNSNLKNATFNSSMNLIVASQKNNPLGIIVFEAKTDKSASILSVFVKQEHRKKGLANLLLTNLQGLLQQNKIQHTQAVFTSENIDIDIVNKLFAKFQDFNLIIEDV